MSYSIDPQNPINNPVNILKDNVRMVLDENYLDNVKASMTENSWEILNVSNMKTFVFPDGCSPRKNSNEELLNARYESGGRCWCPSQIDIAIVFETIGDSNIESLQDDVSKTCPSFIKPKDYMSEDFTKGIANRPCGFLTPRETLMPMIIIPTQNYIQNGIVLYTDKDKIKPDNTYSVITSEYNNCFNWIVKTNMEDGTNKYDKIYFYGEKKPTQEGFSFINQSNSVNGVEKIVSTRYYFLNDFVNGDGKFYYKLPNNTTTNSDITQESLIFSSDYGGGFAFCYNFHGIKSGENEKEKPSISLTLNGCTINIPQAGNIEVNIGNNKSYGTVENSKNSQKMGQLLEKTFNGNMLIAYPTWNGIAISGGIDDSSTLKDSKGTINVTVDKGFIAYKNNDIEMSDFCHPSIKKYDTSKPTPMEVKKTSKSTKKTADVKWGSSLDLRTINCLSSFAYTPVFFQKNLKFSLYLKDNSGKEISTELDAVMQNNTRNHYLYPIFFLNNTEYSIPTEVKGKKIILDNDTVEDQSEKEIYYRFDFEFKHRNGLYPRRGIEIFGFFHRVTVKNKTREMTNENGRIKLSSSDYGFVKKFNENYLNYSNIIKESWIEYATDISVNRSSEQSGGTIQLDKYAILGQFEQPPQPVGEVRLKAIGGNNNVYRGKDVYFTGLGVGMSYQDASQSDTMTLNLHGIEKKLQDIKLAGSPFFDGDPIEDVVEYLSEYANFQYEFNNEFNKYKYNGQNELNKTITDPSVSPSWMKKEKAPCPRSVEFKRPSINFLLGTTVYEALKQVCQKTNKTFFITKEGVVRIVDQNIYGVPVNIAHSLSKNTPSLKIDSNQILNISLQPYFENTYNQVVTASLKGKRKGLNTPISPLTPDDMMPNVLYDKIDNGNVKFPWSRMIVNNELAILSNEEAQKVHSINCTQFAYATFSGGLTIPGNADLEIFDTISIDDRPEIFYISGINHSYSSSTRVWTTSLQVSYIDPKFGDMRLTLFNEDPNPRGED